MTLSRTLNLLTFLALGIYALASWVVLVLAVTPGLRGWALLVAIIAFASMAVIILAEHASNQALRLELLKRPPIAHNDPGETNVISALMDRARSR